MNLRLLVIALFLLAGLANVAQAQCHAQYFDGTVPQILNRGMADKTTPLCFEAFAVMHSGVTRTPLWSAEHLTRSNLYQARSLKTRQFLPSRRIVAGRVWRRTERLFTFWL
ncbi:DNA/RNA non-specific endonuclease [Undibacterium arcticum]